MLNTHHAWRQPSTVAPCHCHLCSLSSPTACPSYTPTRCFTLQSTHCPSALQVRREMLAQARNGIIISPLTSFDGNVITPGTPFMARLAAHLRRFLAYKVGNDSDWRHIQVIPALVHVVICNISARTVHSGNAHIHQANMVWGNTHQPTGWHTAGAWLGCFTVCYHLLEPVHECVPGMVSKFKAQPC